MEIFPKAGSNAVSIRLITQVTHGLDQAWNAISQRLAVSNLSANASHTEENAVSRTAGLARERKR